MCKPNFIASSLECKARILAIIDEDCDSHHVCANRHMECKIINEDFNPNDPEQIRARWIKAFTGNANFEQFSKNDKIMKVEL